MRAVLVRTTFPDTSSADQVIEVLVRERLVACGQRGAGIRSVYPWQGAIESSEEIAVEFKSLDAAVDELWRRLGELHPYDVPEFVVFEVDASPEYLAWIGDWVRPEPA